MSTTKKFPSPADFQFVASLHVCSQKVPLSDKFSFQIVEKSSNHAQIQVHIWDLFHSNMPKSRNLDTF